MMRQIRRAWIALRARALFLVPVGLAFVLAAFAMAPAQTLWFQTLSARVSATTGAFPPPDPPDTSVRGTATSTPSATSSSCNHDWHDYGRLDGDLSLSGAGPFDAVIEITNDGESAIRGGLLGFAPVAGWAYVSRVDFGNGQSWIVDGRPGSTLYLVGDLEPGDSSRVHLRISMTDAWRAAPTGARVDIGVDLVGRSCGDQGDSEHIHISDDHEDGTLTPSPQPSRTATASATATPIPAQMSASPTFTATSESGTPAATPTSAPGDP